MQAVKTVGLAGLVLLFLGSSPAVPQEAREAAPEKEDAARQEAVAEGAPEVAETPPPPVTPAGAEEADEKEDFIPTEEISADRPVSFPVDI